MHTRFFLFFLFISYHTIAQDSTLYYNATLLLSGATGPTPFWVHANQSGNIPLNGNFGLAKAGVYKIYNKNNPRLFQWRGAVEGVGTYGNDADVFLSDAYIAAKLGIIEVLAGQKQNITGIVDTILTSGSLSASGNARPFPRFQIAIPDYQPLYFTNDVVSIKFSYSDGLLDGSKINYGLVREVDQTYFHQKTLYLRFGRQSDRLKIYAGGNHQVVWGKDGQLAPLYNLKLPEEYLHVISGKSRFQRIIGDHFGTYDIGADWKDKTWSYFIYRQNIFETGSLFKAINFEDGLNGIRMKRNRITNVNPARFLFHSFLLEVLNTKSQINSNPASMQALYEYGNYYNHYIYQNGWSYKNRGMGTPLLSGAGTTNALLPRNGSEFTNNNRVLAFHTGFTASWHQTAIAFKGTYSRNYGSYIASFNGVKQQLSLILSAEKNLKVLDGISTYVSLSSDIGGLYPGSSGLSIGLRKKGWLD